MQDWATDFSLFESGVKTNPNNVKLRNNYAMELKSAGRITEARAQYEVSLVPRLHFPAFLLHRVKPFVWKKAGEWSLGTTLISDLTYWTSHH